MSGYQLSGDAPAAYHRFSAKIMEPWTDDLILSSGCQDGDHVLDLACGTGLVAARVNLVTGKLCKVVGIDLNEGMLNVARSNTGVEWRQGSATDLPFGADSFEVVLCQQGLQYFPDRAAAMREMARVLAPGGRLALCVWGALDRLPFQAAIVDATGVFLGSEARSAFDLAFSLHSADALRKLAEEAGFQNVRVRFEHRTARYSNPARLVEGFMTSTPVAAQFAGLRERKEAFVAHAVERLASYVDDAGLAVPMENHFLTASLA